MNLELANSILSLLAPEEVITNFELVSLKDDHTHFILVFEELGTLVPSAIKGSYKLNGFMNKIELNTFPQKVKACLLQINRRRWLDNSSNTIHHNTYKFSKEGMKATLDLGDFIKNKVESSQIDFRTLSLILDVDSKKLRRWYRCLP